MRTVHLRAIGFLLLQLSEVFWTEGYSQYSTLIKCAAASIGCIYRYR